MLAPAPGFWAANGRVDNAERRPVATVVQLTNVKDGSQEPAYSPLY